MQIKKGEAFVSETDTEVIPKLCKYIYSSSHEKVPFHEVRLQHLEPVLGCLSIFIEEVSEDFHQRMCLQLACMWHALLPERRRSCCTVGLAFVRFVHRIASHHIHISVACAAGPGGSEQVRGCIRSADQERILPRGAGGLQARVAPAAGSQDSRPDPPYQPQAPNGQRWGFRGIHRLRCFCLRGAHQSV